MKISYNYIRKGIYNRFEIDCAYSDWKDLPSWFDLSPSKKSKFENVWNTAVNWFFHKGFTDTDELFRLICRLSIEADCISKKPDFNEVLKSLRDIQIQFDKAFPNYRKNGGIYFLRKVMNDRALDGEPTEAVSDAVTV